MTAATAPRPAESPAADPSGSAGVKPGAFIVGAPKCGTTALAKYLAEHPQFFMAAPKEPFYWDSDHPGGRRVHGLHALEDYLALFEGADPARHKAVGEGSTTYLQSRTAVADIAAFNPEARFIAMFRNPVDVAHGMHGQLSRHHLEDVEDFEEAWRLQEARAEGRRLPADPSFAHQLQYRDVATFAPQIRRLFEHVPEDRRLVIIFDDFKADAGREYRRALDFLGLDDDGRDDFPKVNAARTYRSKWLGKLYRSDNELMRRVRSWAMKSEGPVKRLVKAAAVRKAPRKPIRPEFRRELEDVFRPDLEETSELLGRDLTHWVKGGER